jgi:LacI family transcriptional regulator
MKDIANDLGISTVAVSKALHNHSDISEETRQRVLRRAADLNYQPNWAACSLLSGRTYSIGLIVPDLLHPFFAEVAKSIARNIRATGYHLVIASCEENAIIEQENIELMLNRQVDALLMASAMSAPIGVDMCKTRRIPCILVDRYFQGRRCHYVGTDNVKLGFMATEHLIGSGSRIIAHIRGPAISTGAGRFEGYRKALLEYDMRLDERYVVPGRSADDAADSSGYEAMRHLLQVQPRPDGVFCYNDAVAVGAIDAILECGLRVPENITVIGAGNMRWVDRLRVPLSSIDQNAPNVGERAAELALEAVESKTPSQVREVLVPPRLVARESSRRATPGAVRFNAAQQLAAQTDA